MSPSTGPGTVARVIAQSRNQAEKSGTSVDPAWWAYGLALHERLAGDVPSAAADGTPGRAGQRLAGWRAALGSAGEFERRLAEGGLDEPTLLGLLGEPRACLAARVPKPAWAEMVERVLRRAAPVAADLDATAGWRETFAVPLRPFVADAAEGMVEQARRLLDPAHADLDATAERFAAHLSRRLTGIAARTFVHEYNKGVADGDFRRLADFARRTAEPAGLTTLVTAYPVLARLLGQVCLLAVEATVELLARFAADRAAIVDTLFGGVDPGRVASVATGAGDPHRRGRSVAILSFADGARLVYKPRDLAVHQRFGAMVGRLNQLVPGLELRSPDVLARPGYGWLEFIPHRPLTDPAGAERFYRRQGALLALLHVVRAADVHCENLIACGDQPVLVDAETLFQAGVRVPGGAVDPAARTLTGSVHRTGLLPMVMVGEHGVVEVSGLGGERGQPAERTTMDWAQGDGGELRLVRRSVTFPGADNRPRLGERELDAIDHEGALTDGFRLGYHAIMRDRAEFTALIEASRGTEVRVVARHTRGYATLLAESTHPGLLSDALERDRALDLLWTESARHPVRWRMCRHEQADLWAHDIPLFTARADATSLSSSDGQPIPDVLERPGLAGALDTIGAMSEVDHRDQEWIISATMATLRSTVEHHGAEPAAGPDHDTAAPPERLLAAACAVADQIVARSMTNGDRVNWLGLEPVEDRRWMVVPMGAGLANGYTGVALFLAQLAELTGIVRYGEVARQAIGAIPRLHATLSTRPDLVAAVGCGGLQGFGGIAYALARMATLLADDELRAWARTAVDLAARSAGTASRPGVAAGSAGCLAAMSAVHTEIGHPAAARLAGECADRLLDVVAQAEATTAPAGFTNGTAGIGWALARFSRAGGDDRHAEAARATLNRLPRATDGTAPLGWCAGLAGHAVARTAAPDGTANDVEPGTVVRLLADRPVLRDLSLCHGELGIAEALTVLAGTGHDSGPARRRRAALIIGAVSRHGTACGTPGRVVTPGLLTGLAGIGYGLLRLGFRERVPSVLLFEPTPRPAGRGC